MITLRRISAKPSPPCTMLPMAAHRPLGELPVLLHLLCLSCGFFCLFWEGKWSRSRQVSQTHDCHLAQLRCTVVARDNIGNHVPWFHGWAMLGTFLLLRIPLLLLLLLVRCRWLASFRRRGKTHQEKGRVPDANGGFSVSDTVFLCCSVLLKRISKPVFMPWLFVKFLCVYVCVFVWVCRFVSVVLSVQGKRQPRIVSRWDFVIMTLGKEEPDCGPMLNHPETHQRRN